MKILHAILWCCELLWNFKFQVCPIKSVWAIRDFMYLLCISCFKCLIMIARFSNPFFYYRNAKYCQKFNFLHIIKSLYKGSLDSEQAYSRFWHSSRYLQYFHLFKCFQKFIRFKSLILLLAFIILLVFIVLLFIYMDFCLIHKFKLLYPYLFDLFIIIWEVLVDLQAKRFLFKVRIVYHF